MGARTWPRPFTSAPNRRELIAVLLYLPVHLLGLRWILTGLMTRGALSAGAGNLAYYGVGFFYMLAAAFGFLRRDFDALCDRPLRALGEVLVHYALMLALNLLVGTLLLLLRPDGLNPNNEALLQAAAQDGGAVTATVVFLAPVVEELLFRAGVFGLLRRRSRLAAYAVSALGFSFYHVAPYAFSQPACWLYLVQYLPASFLLARCYERTNTIWCSIFFHMLVNGVTMAALQAVQEML